MYQLYYQPEGIWVGDIMPYGKEGQFYVYHQRKKESYARKCQKILRMNMHILI